MKRIFPTLTIAFFFLAACNSAKKPSAANFTTAINQYLATHGLVCISIGSQFPIDIPISQNDQGGTATELAALERAGLVNATNTIAVVQSLANSLSLSPHKPEPVKRYTVSGEGQKYLQTVMTDFGKTSGFCYGQKQVDSIVKWAEQITTGSSSHIEVTYTYKVVNVASWAKRGDVEEAFPMISSSISSISRSEQMADLLLTNTGWVVPSS